ncbi:MAG: ABC transporter permease [Proteobacteria bacterium]|nr:ABC transporter permease [Pseudomonadota bacterium]
MRRVLLIARREYAAYTRTVGFWLSLVLAPSIMAMSIFGATALKNSTPSRAVAVADYTGQGTGAALGHSFDDTWRQSQARALSTAASAEAGKAGADEVRSVALRDGPDAGFKALQRVAPHAAAGYHATRPPVRVVEAPAPVKTAKDADAAEAAARRFVAGESSKTATVDAIAVLRLKNGQPVVRLWTVRAADDASAGAVRDAMKDVVREQRLAAAGVDAATVRAIDDARPDVELLSPAAASGGAVSLKDRLPTYVGFGAGFLLWTLVLTGAGILLNSVMEEKSTRVLEVLLSSADTGEIIAGKVLGVACIALSVMAVWAALGLGALTSKFPDAMAYIGPILSDGPFWLLTAVYFAGGYLMYGVLFAAIGAFCETPRDAQTLLGPMMMFLMVPLFVLQFGIRAPDMALFRILSWVPFFTPFLMPARLAAHPPAMEIAGTIAGMAVLAAVMMWIGGRAFRTGALSSGAVGLKGVIAAMTGKQG